MASEKSVEQAVKKYMAANIGVPAARITPATKLQDSLRLNDPQPFMVQFGKKFDVDMTAFRIERHYGPVGMVSIPTRMLFLLLFRKSYGFKPLTAEHLLAAAKAKKWPTG